MEALIKFEREPFVESVGSKQAKINFLQAFPLVAKFKKESTSFYCAGIYQLEDGPPIIVLPWFMKNELNLEGVNNSLQVSVFMDVLKEIKIFEDSLVDLHAAKDKFVAIDIIAFSYLLRLQGYVKDLVVNNYHEDVTERSNVIKGKWDISKDLVGGPKPIIFTCTYGTVEKSNHFLAFAKSFATYLLQHVRSSKSLSIINDILKDLREVDFLPLNKKLLSDANVWISRHDKFSHMKGAIDFAEAFFINDEICAKNAGFSYQFPMDKFFEDLMEKFISLNREYKVFSQTREELLGGAVWKGQTSTLDDVSTKGANQYSVPDIVAYNYQYYFIFECKYKPFRIPFINQNINDVNLSRFERNDRNQILSFLMSLRPSILLSKRSLEFCILFPCNTVEEFARTDLEFESAKLNIDPIVKKIIQNKSKLNGEKCLKVSFIGLNVTKVIEAVLNNNSSFSKQYFALLSERSNALGLIKEEKFNDILDKRVSLANLIVQNSKDVKTLGRVKLAKILYLADVHLKLNLDANYVREAAGPLDQRLLYNDKVGIESVAQRNAFFNTVKSKDGLGYRYVPASNFESGIKKAEAVLFDKIENITWLLKIMEPLDTERSEIVATLYACWNDLKKYSKLISDEDIVDDFMNNWHPSKARFDVARILKALQWLKNVGLVPDGDGPICAPKWEKIPSGF